MGLAPSHQGYLIAGTLVLFPVWAGLVGSLALVEARTKINYLSWRPGAGSADNVRDVGLGWITPIWAATVACFLGLGFSAAAWSAQIYADVAVTRQSICFFWIAPPTVFLLAASKLGTTRSTAGIGRLGPAAFIWTALAALEMTAHTSSTLAALLAAEIVFLCSLVTIVSVSPLSGPNSAREDKPILIMYWVSAASAFLTLWGLSVIVHDGGSIVPGLFPAVHSQAGYSIAAAGLATKGGVAAAGWWIWPLYRSLTRPQLLTYASVFAPPTLILTLTILAAWLPELAVGAYAPTVLSWSTAVVWWWSRRTTSCWGVFAVSSVLGSALMVLGAST